MNAPPAADRNLLFGILALQMDFIGKDALIAAMHAWVLDKTRQLGQILVEQGALSSQRQVLLDALVREHLKQHGQDSEASLAALRPVGVPGEELRQIADPELQASLAYCIGTKRTNGLAPVTGLQPNEGDPLLTRDETHVALASSGVRFRILRPHAEGGLGKVSVARDEELRREVALKEIKDRHADSPESRDRFLREATITGGLEHPGIVPVYGLGHHDDGRPWYAMRFIQGDSLQEAIRRYHKGRQSTASGEPESSRDSGFGSSQPEPCRERSAPLLWLSNLRYWLSTRPATGARALELRQMLQRFVAVCNAVAYAHSRGVLHRDLKPANVMLGKYGETLVVDWGLAKQVGTSADVAADEPPLPESISGSGETVAGTALGTPQYMSPEQAAGRLDLLGPATDVYSLGATLYCLLTGRAPFLKEEAGEVLRKVQKGDFLRPRQVRRDVPPALEAVCLKAMALKPVDRYATPHQLAEDLERWLADEPVLAFREPWSLRAGRWLRRHRTGTTAGVAVILVGSVILAVATVLLTTAYGEAERQRDLAVEHADQADRERLRADEQTRQAKLQTELVRRTLYAAHMNLVQRSWEKNDMLGALSLLKKYEPTSELVRPEWHGYTRLCHSEVASLPTESDSVHRIAVSPGGRLLAATDTKNHRVELWDLATRKKRATLSGHSRNTQAVAFHPDGRRLASCAYDGTVRIWDLATEKQLMMLRHPNGVYDVAVSPDGTVLASSGKEDLIFWDLLSGTPTGSISMKGHSPANTIAFSPDGKLLATAEGDDLGSRATVWDVNTRKEVHSFKGYDNWVRGVAFNPAGTRLATADWGGEGVVWDLATSQQLFRLIGHTGVLDAVAYSPDGKLIATASHDHTIKLWNAQSGKEMATLKGHLRGLTGVTFSPDGQRLASCTFNGEIAVWNVGYLLEAREFNVVQFAAPAFSPDSKHIACPSGNTVELREVITGQVVRILQGHQDAAEAVAYSPDGRYLASASMDRTVKLWDLGSGQVVRSFQGHTGAVTGVAFHARQPWLASAALDGTVRVWHRESGALLHTLQAHDGPFEKNKIIPHGMILAFSPDGDLLASSGAGVRLKIWDPARGVLLQDHGLMAWALAFSPDSKQLASMEDGSIRIRDARTLQKVRTFGDGFTYLKSVAYSTDGDRLVTCNGGWGTPSVIKFWDQTTGQELCSFRVSENPILNVAISPDSRWLAATSSLGTLGGVKLFDLRPSSPQIQVEREALGLIDFLLKRPLPKDAALACIQAHAALPEPVRAKALELLPLFPEESRHAVYDNASRTLSRQPHLSPLLYRDALLQAQAACRLAPQLVGYQTTLAMAQYRAGQYREALDTLSRLEAKRFVSPITLALQAMTHYRLGQIVDSTADLVEKLRLEPVVTTAAVRHERAQACLVRMRQLLKSPAWAKNAEAALFATEAEELLQKTEETPQRK